MIKNSPFASILVIDDERNLRTILKAQLTRGGYDCITASNAKEALAIIEEYPEITTVLTDLKMPGMDGVELMLKIHESRPWLPIIILTAFGSINSAVEAVKAGAFDYIEKPFDKSFLMETVNKAVATYSTKLKSANPMEKPSIPGKFGIIGHAPSMVTLFKLIEKVAKSSSTVLISGESGTGKELVAQAVHNLSPRNDKPFVRVNCAAIPNNLMESEFFGYEKGAFTGATVSKPGRFELADKGSILLDEISEIPVSMQAKLLRILQENEFERVGGIVTKKLDTRIIACTNKNLELEINEGRFREDLFYRLNVVPIHLPPLRERIGDIPLLIDFFLKKYNIANQTDFSFTKSSITILENHNWSGNIRELENMMERTLILAENSIIRPEDLPLEITKKSGTLGVVQTTMEFSDSGLKEVVRRETSRIEKDLIHKALDSTKGNVTKAAAILKISRKGLQNKIKELEILKNTD
jgi:two-component system, NtrC family, response regulator AtoC